jgi:hypothetical protein
MTTITEKLLKSIGAKVNSGMMRKVGLMQNSEQRIFRNALVRAYAIWAPQNWEWVDYLFNEHFLTYRATNFLINYYLDNGTLETAIFGVLTVILRGLAAILEISDIFPYKSNCNCYNGNNCLWYGGNFLRQLPRWPYIRG